MIWKIINDKKIILVFTNEFKIYIFLLEKLWQFNKLKCESNFSSNNNKMIN